jgi:signal transduction histidine kinase
LTFPQRLFWKTRPWQALLESCLAWIILLLTILQTLDYSPTLVVSATLMLFSAACAVLAALRWRLPLWTRWRSVRDEAIKAGFVSILFILIAALLFYTSGRWILLEKNYFGSFSALWLVGFSAPIFLFIRLVGFLWRWWDAFQKRRFLWSLTNTYLTVALNIGLILAFVGVGLSVYFALQNAPAYIATTSNPIETIEMQLLIWILLLVFIFGASVLIVLLVLVFPSVLLSSAAARRLTPRLENLANAASKMGKGDLSTRIPIQGEDEIARLQADFNRMAAQLEKSTHELQEERDRVTGLLQAQRDLTVNVSHELRTPVSTVAGYLDAALINWKELPPKELQHDLEIMAEELSQLNLLIDDLFTISQAEVNRLSLRIQPLQVADLLQQITTTLSTLAWENKRIEILVEPLPSLPLVQADPVRLKQVILNLIQNGLRHTPPGGFIALSAQVEEKWVCIEVQDSGEGISEQDLPHIWERFFRSSLASDGGAGLGLALVKELIEGMGGKISVTSQPGEGSTFRIYLQHDCDTIQTAS